MSEAKVILEKNGGTVLAQMMGSPIELLALLLHGIAGVYGELDEGEKHAFRCATVAALINDDPVWSRKADGKTSFSVKIPVQEDANDENV